VYSIFRVRSSHVLGNSPFGALLFGSVGVPLLSGRVIASRISVIVLLSLDQELMFAVEKKKERASRCGLSKLVGTGETEDVFAGGEATGPNDDDVAGLQGL